VVEKIGTNEERSKLKENTNAGIKKNEEARMAWVPMLKAWGR
jgi:hypothetical protein